MLISVWNNTWKQRIAGIWHMKTRRRHTLQCRGEHDQEDKVKERMQVRKTEEKNWHSDVHKSNIKYHNLHPFHGEKCKICNSYTQTHGPEEGHEGDSNWHCASNLVAGSLRFKTFKTEKQSNLPDLQVSDRFRQITSKWLHLAPGELELLTASTLKDPMKIRSTSRIEVILYLLVYPFSFQST